MIADEVQSGMGRTGTHWWACDHVGIVPDILVCGKGLAAGYAPISAAIGRVDLVQALQPGQQAFSLAGHTLSARAALTTIGVIQKEQYLERNSQVGQELLDGFAAIQNDFPGVIAEVRGQGLMIGVEIHDYKNSFALSGGQIFAARGVSLGVYFGYFGVNHQVLRVEPSFLLSNADVKVILQVSRQVAQEMHDNTVPIQVLEQLRKYSVGL